MTTRAAGAVATPSVAAEKAENEWWIANGRQPTFGGERAGDGHVSGDETERMFQSQCEPGNVFHRIYLTGLITSDTRWRLGNGSPAIPRAMPCTA